MSLPTSPVPLFVCEHSRLLALLFSCVTDGNETWLVLKGAWLHGNLRSPPWEAYMKLS